MPEVHVSLDQFQQFEFSGHGFDAESGQLELRWCWHSANQKSATVFSETFQFPLLAELSDVRHDQLTAAFNLLHWIAGVSYWKMRCKGDIAFAGLAPTARQAKALTELYRHGLAELAWRNQLERPYWPEFEAVESGTAPEPAVAKAGLSRRVLVALGGGKDSLVALERVRAAGFEPITVQVGSAALIGETAAAAGTEHRIIRRSLSPNLAGFNRAGAINGHVPITAINSAVLVIAALLWDCDTIVFANERSADAPTLVHEGQPINHQFAKSLAFEQLFGDWVQRYIASDLRVFSILRRESELAICREFACLDQYHGVFSSCNRNFHLDGPRTSRWCGRCPKCLFVYLALAPFLSPEPLRAIFGKDLLADAGLLDGFAELLEIDTHRPFECVGEAKEARVALRLLAESTEWDQHVVVKKLLERMHDHGLDFHSIEPDPLLKPVNSHRIPSEFLQ